ncbi:metal-binding protein [Actinobacillus pleuropneumoniae]|nr:metal-binding protein [Actinobacillus pleuropneumoniae]
MGLSNLELEQIIDEKLNSKAITDYAPNGLQVEGKTHIQRIITGVTASLPLIEKAIEKKGRCDFGTSRLFLEKANRLAFAGMKGKRIKQLLVNDINLFGFHLPLDIHSELGNNAQLAKKLGVINLQGLEDRPNSIPVYGELETPISAQDLENRIETVLNRKTDFMR